MADAFEVRLHEGLAEVRLLRQLTLAEVLEVMDEVARVVDGNRRLWDLTGHFSFSADEVREISRRGRRNWPEAARVAYLAQDDLGFGVARMLEVYREESEYETRVFRDRDEALAWLRAGGRRPRGDG